ncbi:BTB/POZ domain-containing protein 17-like isoform X1 [Mytilus californianus]|uniref:BTB/POZ domain-containing protein 17-like isoform X1 n=2 Tax=Mytilus californianus TaxID=6549 RepID=UPI002246B20E|nr:BTB/POZ domain-containing protein 17-like isoform X1 [Mytilus californianus]
MNSMDGNNTRSGIGLGPDGVLPSMEVKNKKMEEHEQENDDEHETNLKDERSFIENISKFYGQTDLRDITLNIGDDSYSAHKFVLAKDSDVFRAMLYDDNWSKDNQTELALSETPECRAVFDKFLRYFYTADISVTVESSVGILCLADKYCVTSLKNLCTQYMIEKAKSPKVKNALSWYAWSKALGLTELIQQCAQTIAWNTDTLLKLKEWPGMDFDFVSDLLRNEDLVLQNEYLLYESLLQWLFHESHRSDLRENANKLFPLIRFPQMTVNQLYQIENSDIVEQEECKDVLNSLVCKAYRFRSLCPSQGELDVMFNEPFYLPRNYLDLVVDTVRMQNTLRFGIQVDVKTYAGPVPTDKREGEWKITYRKNGDSWTLQIFCHDSATVNGEARVQASVIVYDEDEKVIQVEQVPTFVCSRGNNLALNLNVNNPDDSKLMAIILKPVPKTSENTS